MDDFSIVENSFDECLAHLTQVLKHCEETKRCHFMVNEGIVLGHKFISEKGIEVDPAKIEVIS